MDLINDSGLYEQSAKNKPENEKNRLRVTTKELVIGEDYDSIIASYPTSTTEVYTYKKSGNDVLVVTVTYLTASKKDIASVVAT
jgi:hypothetical protein